MKRASSSASASRSSSVAMGRRRICKCMENLVLLTSHSEDNPDRKFWRCTNWHNAKDCGHFKWADEEDEADLEAALRHLELQLVKITLQEEQIKPKIAKLEKKLVQQRFQKKVVMVFAALSCLVVMMFCFCRSHAHA
ncbi:uncharacterized protein At1g43920, Chloroplastic-like [Lotus japonicus]|uniref:uncharacterized protein At1g43920, Chloroplastic-like n=1 Tax=Lotus japonicus TaxID=34305 RepID=UPI002586DBAA|nr:uncharacterized protein At1g43920, Chloroplastic-like [Lotus japonicus]